jgi:hypothetical protein
VAQTTDGRGSQRGAPLQLRSLSVERSAVASLADDTVAQIVRVLHKTRIQISGNLPQGLHAAVARHMARHRHECTTRNCAQARAWLADVAAVRGGDTCTAVSLLA